VTIPVIATKTANDTGGASVTTLTLTKPTGVAVGDGLLLLVGGDQADQASPQWNAVSGWNRESTDGAATTDAHYGVYSRIADGTEDVDVDVTTANEGELYGWYIRMTGIDTAAFINVVGAAHIGAGNPATHEIDGVTTTVDDCLAIFILAFDGADGEPFDVSNTGWSLEDEDHSGTEINEASGCFGTKDQATAGATGNVTITHGSPSGDGGAGVVFAVAPTSTPGQPPGFPVSLFHHALMLSPLLRM
jgi:hypothetical protein